MSSGAKVGEYVPFYLLAALGAVNGALGGTGYALAVEVRAERYF